VVRVSGDPLGLLRDALEAHVYGPHGTEYAFRSRCPAHDGDNRSALSVRVGADGRAVLYCHAHQCTAEAITASLGLRVSDLFPDGHHRGRRHPLRAVARSDFDAPARTLVNVLAALEVIDEPWRVLLTCDCPYCDHPGAWLRASRDHVDVDCPNGCGTTEFVQALLGRITDKETT
jgi:hypothetical protein